MIYYLSTVYYSSRIMDTLPLELLHEIASHDIKAYRALFVMRSFVESLKPMVMIEYRIRFGYSVEITKNTIKWYLDGQLHRVDGPAIEWNNGYKYWYLKGQLHRVDGPAMEWADGSKEWYVNGEFIRK